MEARTTLTLLLLACSGAQMGCGPSPHVDAAATADPEITAFVGRIRAVDNHSHANSVAPGDSDQDALPLEVISPFEVPVQLRPNNPDWLAAYKALYKYPHTDTSDAHLNELRGAMQRIAQEQGERFPAWVLDQVGTDVLLTNRVAMGPGLAPPRFRWVCLFGSRRRNALEAERLPGYVGDDAALHAGQARRSAEGLAHSVSGEGALRNRRRRARAG